jgi:beta-galactosidase
MTNTRERLSLDGDWRFALGHACDAAQDYGTGTSHFSHLAKAGFGDGAAAQGFDARAWRKLDLPHDWCVELPFSELGSSSHGYKAIGHNFPENSIGWYRKSLFIPASDLGRRIALEFDGVYRASVVWVNGFYLGTELSGYSGFSYDVSDYLDYGGENVVAVRVDATMEEGWFYEGAGIYRHVWLTKTSPLHVARHGTFVTTEIEASSATITVRTTVVNASTATATFDLEETIVAPQGKRVARGQTRQLCLPPGSRHEYSSTHEVADPQLWSLETPHLYRLQTVLRSGKEVFDAYETPFGIRSIRFDADEGFFLNGQHVKILGTNNHQDHAGVGTAIPDALQAYRVRRLKAMGSNSIRTSHNPPTPELLDVCDRLGMLVLDENRLMGCNHEHLDHLESLIVRDRNHPCVILWSLGNEEWAIEDNVKGSRIAATMQRFAQRLDPSRPFTVACSGGWNEGIGPVIQVMGYNYIFHGDIDEHHAKFPHQPGVGSEESNTVGTRGVYETDAAVAHLAPTNRVGQGNGTESGWQFYAARPFLAGLYYWTGFDYRGEPTPFEWPAIASQFGILDLCGFPKDTFFYLKAWWGDEPVLHVSPHWNWPGREGDDIQVSVYSNCQQVELFLNDESLGRQDMPQNGHLEWTVPYQPGVLLARGYVADQEIITGQVETTGEAGAVQLSADRGAIRAHGRDVAVIAAAILDEQGRMIPTAGNELQFSVQGPGRIIGVGNGDPSSHEPDRFFETVTRVEITDLKELAVDDLTDRPEVAAGYDDSGWRPAFESQSDNWEDHIDPLIVVRGTFELPQIAPEATVTLFAKSVVEVQSVYVNGHLLAAGVERDAPDQAYVLDHAIIQAGPNDYAVVGERFRKKSQWDEPNTDPGLVQVLCPAPQWKRNAFNGLAQVIIQPAGQPGEIALTAASPGLDSAVIQIEAAAAP